MLNRLFIFTIFCSPIFSLALYAQMPAEQNAQLFQKIKQALGFSDEQMTKLRAVFAKSPYVGQGNPKITQHPLTEETCSKNAADKKIDFLNPQFEKICGAKFMAPLYDPSKEKPEQAKACIDLFEFPNIPCTYPVVWVRAKEAAEICESVGKRMCDAHEWEGACEGALTPPDYKFELGMQKMRAAHNAAASKNYAYGGSTYKKGLCAANSTKANDCNGGDFQRCGSNTYPSGSFLDCKSPLGAYDLHGNAAEHMNLPLAENQMASRGSKELGVTEMKGSWFIFDKFQAHQDYCRWRAPYWHGTRVLDEKSHHNYHLGFRCCKTLP